MLAQIQHIILSIFPLYRQTVSDLVKLQVVHENYLAHKKSISKLQGMNQKQVEELKNHYLACTGRLPGDENQNVKPPAKDDASNFSELARSIHAARAKKLDL